MTISWDVHSIITPLTAYYLEDTNWYKMNWDYVRESYWGYKRGCEFLSVTTGSYCPITLPEYSMAVGESLCSSDFGYKIVGVTSTATDYFESCPKGQEGSLLNSESVDCTSMQRSLEFDLASSYLQESYGPSARCFLSQYHSANIEINGTIPTLPVCQNAKVIFCLLVFNRKWKA